MNESQINFILSYLISFLYLYGIHVFFSEDSKLISSKNIKPTLVFSLMISPLLILPHYMKPILNISILFLIIYVFFEVNTFQAFIGSNIVLLIGYFSELLGIFIGLPFIFFDFATMETSLKARLILSIIILFINISLVKILKKRIRAFISSKSILKKHHVTISTISIFFILLIYFVVFMFYYDILNFKNKDILFLILLFISFSGLSYVVFKIDSVLKKSIIDNPDEITKEIIPGRVLVNGRLIKIESINSSPN